MGARVHVREGWLSVRISWQGRRWSEATGVHVDDPEADKVRRATARLDAEIRDGKFSAARYLEYFPAGNRSGEFGGEATALRRAVPLLRDYAQEWVARKVGVVRIAQERNYKSHLRTICAAVAPGDVTLGSLRLDRVTPAVLEAVRAEWLREGKSTKYAHNILSGTLQALFRDAVEIDGVVSANPCKPLRWPRSRRHDADPFTAGERDVIISAFRAKHAYYAPFVELLFFTGLRPSEAAGLVWGDVDLHKGCLYVRRSRVEGRVEDTKTAQSRRTVDLLPRAVRVLSDAYPVHAHLGTPVFLGPNGAPFCQRRFTERQWRQVIRATRVRPRRLYDARHTFISLALSAGANVFWLSKQVGTSVAMIEQRYGRFMADAASAEIMRLAEHLEKPRSENGTSVAQGRRRGA